MGNDGINFGKCDFSQDVIVGKTELQQNENLEKVKFLFEGMDGIDLTDGIDGKEAKILFDKIGGSDGILSDAELRQAFTDSDKDPSINDVNALKKFLSFVAEKFTKQAEATPQTQTQPPTVTAQTNTNTQTTRTATVKAWGTGEDDCLSRIMKKAYPDVTPYSEEWKELETLIMNANPQIYGDENGNGGRKRIIDGTRHNAVLYTGDVINLPPYPCNGTNATAETPAATSAAPATDATAPADNTNTGNNTSAEPLAKDFPATGLTEAQMKELKEKRELKINKDGVELTYKLDNINKVSISREINGKQRVFAEYYANGSYATYSYNADGSSVQDSYNSDKTRNSQTAFRADGSKEKTIWFNGADKEREFEYAKDGNTTTKRTFYTNGQADKVYNDVEINTIIDKIQTMQDSDEITRYVATVLVNSNFSVSDLADIFDTIKQRRLNLTETLKDSDVSARDDYFNKLAEGFRQYQGDELIEFIQGYQSNTGTVIAEDIATLASTRQPLKSFLTSLDNNVRGTSTTELSNSTNVRELYGQYAAKDGNFFTNVLDDVNAFPTPRTAIAVLYVEYGGMSGVIDALDTLEPAVQGRYASILQHILEVDVTGND